MDQDLETLIKDIKIKSYNQSIEDLHKSTKFLILDNVKEEDIPKSGKVIFITCNPYYNTSFALGNPICNDCKLINEIYIKHDYISFTLFDQTKEAYVKWLKFFTSQKYDDLILYYSGHGTQICNTLFNYNTNKFEIETFSNSEDDDLDECFVFKNNILSDDDITEIVNNNKCKNILMICDCCHSGTILDKIPENVTLLSSCKDAESSIQLRENGIFSYYISLYSSETIKTMMEKITMKIKRYGQNPVMSGKDRNYLIME